MCTRFCIHNLWCFWHLLHVLQAIHFGLAFRLIRKLGTIPNCSWECLNSHKFPKCLSTMCKEVRGIARHRFLRFLVEKGSKKANEFEGSITFPESNGSRVLHPHNWVTFSISQSKEGNRITLGPVQKKRLPETDQTRSTFECFPRIPCSSSGTAVSHALKEGKLKVSGFCSLGPCVRGVSV